MHSVTAGTHRNAVGDLVLLPSTAVFGSPQNRVKPDQNRVETATAGRYNLQLCCAGGTRRESVGCDVMATQKLAALLDHVVCRGSPTDM